VVKALDAPYSAGRRGASWLKVKPVHTLDLVVLAAEWGHGRRTGKLSNLHLGARNEDGSFAMLGKTFKGMTDAMLTWQTGRLQELAVEDNGHVVTVRPELVVEIAYDGLQKSTRYPPASPSASPRRALPRGQDPGRGRHGRDTARRTSGSDPMSGKRSAGLLLYRHTDHGPEVLLGHMGGPFFSRRDAGAWSVPKGEYEPTRPPGTPRVASSRKSWACRRPTGRPYPSASPADERQGRHGLGDRGGLDPATMVPGTFEMECRRRSGRRQEFPSWTGWSGSASTGRAR